LRVVAAVVLALLRAALVLADSVQVHKQLLLELLIQYQ
jgi:hypothetical protein